jgi:transposase-like protein
MTSNTDTAMRAIQCLIEGCSIRSTERLTGLNRNTILRLLEVVGMEAGLTDHIWSIAELLTQA